MLTNSRILPRYPQHDKLLLYELSHSTLNQPILSRHSSRLLALPLTRLEPCLERYCSLESRPPQPTLLVYCPPYLQYRWSTSHPLSCLVPKSHQTQENLTKHRLFQVSFYQRLIWHANLISFFFNPTQQILGQSNRN